MGTPRDGDDPQTAALRAALRDPVLMARVAATVETWPPLTEDQRATVSALFTRTRTRPAKSHKNTGKNTGKKRKR